MQESQNKIAKEIQELAWQDKNSDESYSNIIAKLQELTEEVRSLSKMGKG